MKTRILDRTAVTFDNVLSLVLIALVPGTLVGGDLFQDNGAFTPTVTKDSVDTARSLAYPGGELPKLGVLRTDRQGHHQSWNTQATTEPAKCHYTIALKEPMALGTVLLVGQYEVSFLRPDADPDPNRDANWTNVPYPGEAGREVRAVPLPSGTVTKAIRLSAPGILKRDGTFQQSLSLATAFAGRYVNISPMAELRVSSNLQPKSGFRPDPRRCDPETLVDGSLQYTNWSSAQRDQPISADQPETILLDWHQLQTMRGCLFLIGAHGSGAGTIVIQQFVGRSDPDALVDDGWQTITEIKPYHPWRPPLCWEAVAEFGQDIRTRALRFVIPAGLVKEQAVGGEAANPNAMSFGEILVLQDLHDDPPQPRGISA